MTVAAYTAASGNVELHEAAFPPFSGTNTEPLWREESYESQILSTRSETVLFHQGPSNEIVAQEPGAGPTPAGSSEVRSWPIGKAIVLDRLNAVRNNGEPDEFGGILKPSEHAHYTATELVKQAAIDLGDDFPLGSVSVDSEGGLRITWFKENREVELACPARAEPAPYIYHEAGTDYDLEERVGGQALSRRLQWLTR